jgi:ATP-dependent exoDNAse (exonuclease V) beta subunit
MRRSQIGLIPITSYYPNNKEAISTKGQIASLLKQVLRYRDRNSHQWDRIKEAEVDVSLVKEDYILKGSIDLIKGENDTVELIDFKSGDKPDVNSTDPIEKRKLNQYRRQLRSIRSPSRRAHRLQSK